MLHSVSFTLIEWCHGSAPPALCLLGSLPMTSSNWWSGYRFPTKRLRPSRSSRRPAGLRRTRQLRTRCSLLVTARQSRPTLVTALPQHPLSSMVADDLLACGVDVTIAATYEGAPITASIMVTEARANVRWCRQRRPRRIWSWWPDTLPEMNDTLVRPGRRVLPLHLTAHRSSGAQPGHSGDSRCRQFQALYG